MKKKFSALQKDIEDQREEIKALLEKEKEASTSTGATAKAAGGGGCCVGS